MNFVKELFAIPDGSSPDSDIFLYAPLIGSVLKVSRGTVGLLKKLKAGQSPIEGEKEVVERLKKFGIIEDTSSIKGEKEKSGRECDTDLGYGPTSVTLLPTLACNLRCEYCYARGGEDTNGVMRSEIAEKAIDFIIKNATARKEKKVHLSFHGGGEPLLRMARGLVKESVEYFRRKTKEAGLKANVSSATNGVNIFDLDWIASNFDYLNISLDGTKTIQDRQRPKANGKGSFDAVMRTIRYLEDNAKQYGIRATITDESVRQMPSILEFFAYSFNVGRFHLEPLFECGRCRTSKAKAPNPGEFLKFAIKTRELAAKLGVELYYSGAKLEEAGDHFCGAAGSNFFVTPSGKITTCLEVCRDDDPRRELFVIGNYAAAGFNVDENKVGVLKDRTVDKMPHCSDCFAKYNCRGDCLAKVLAQSGDLFDASSNERCGINQGLLLYEIRNTCKEVKKDECAKIPA